MAGYGDGAFGIGTYGYGSYEDSSSVDTLTTADSADSVQTFYCPADDPLASIDDTASCLYVDAIQQTVADFVGITDSAATVGGWSIVPG